MDFARTACRLPFCSIAAAFLVACAQPSVVDDDLISNGAPATEFSGDDKSVTLSARFDAALAEDGQFMVEWLFPNGKMYLRKPVRRSPDNPDLIETTLPIRGRAPAKNPGIWQVRLWRGGDKLVDRSFEVHAPPPSAESARVRFASLAFCGPSRWSDPVISGRREATVVTRVPGAWVGNNTLDAAGAVYSGAVLLTGCAPG